MKEISRPISIKSRFLSVALGFLILFLASVLTFLLSQREYQISLSQQQEIPADQDILPPKTTVIVQEVLAQSSSGSASFDLAKFQSYGFPEPQDPNPAAMSNDVLQGWNQYLRNHVAKASTATGVDPGIIGMWPYVETGGSWTPFDNCKQENGGDGDPNTQCTLWGDDWQVGPGNHLAYTYTFLPEAFDVMYGSQDNATVQKVGQSVIDNHPQRFGKPLTIVSSFPNVSLSSIIEGAVKGDMSSRNLMATLMKDDAIGVYLIARHFKDNIGINSGLAAKMEGWSSEYYGRQKIINHIKAIYDAGVSGGGGTTGGLGSGSQTVTLTLRPKDPDSWVINYVTAQAIGGGTGGSTKGSNGAVNPNATCPGRGPLTCGTYDNPIPGGTGHCTPSYMSSVSGASAWCYGSGSDRSSAHYAVDIGNSLGEPVFIPKISINGELRTVSCIFSAYIDSASLPQTILVLSCSDDKTDEAVWMQFHHSDINNKMAREGVTYKSGDQVATTGNYSGNEHIHFQLGIGGPCGSDPSGCVNADEYIKCE